MSNDFKQALLAHELDPDAEPGTEWAEFLAWAAWALTLSDKRKTGLPSPPIDPEARASLERPRAPWGIEEDHRLEFALRLLAVVESGDHTAMRKLADLIETRKQNGVPLNPVVKSWAKLVFNKKAIPNKSELLSQIELDQPNASPRSKKSKWQFFKKHALSWLPQKR